MSYGGFYGGEDLTNCGREKVCDCLTPAILTISNSLERINNTLNEKLDPPCKSIEDCAEKILAKIREKVEGPLASCEQCKTMLANGLGGTIEYAVQCANQTCKQCVDVCSAQDEGKCCSSCGAASCTCKKGECVIDYGEEKEEEKPKKFAGWCNDTSKSILVLPVDQGSPGLGWTQVALGDDEQAVAIEAATNCKQGPNPIFIPSVESQQPDKYSGPSCQFEHYLSGVGPTSHSQRLSLVNFIGATAQQGLAAGNIGVGGIDVNNVGQVLFGGLRWMENRSAYLADKIIPSLVDAFGCDNPTFKGALSALAEFEYVEKAIGVDLSPFTTSWQYTANMSCPTKYMSPDGAMGAYLSNAIDRKSAATLWGMAGFCPENFGWGEQASKAKPVPLQLAVMRHRQLISPSEYLLGMRQLGYIEPNVSEQLFNITYQVPTMTDIIRFMVRDSDDEALVQRLGLDSNFDEKYRSQLKKWSQDQGIPEIVAKYAWRAHWNIPSPTQLFEFWHRLRYNDKFGGKDKLLGDIKAALIQQDILPFWHEHYLAVSFRPMGRVDIRRAFNIGALKEDDLVPAYLQLGYSDDDAKKQARFTVRLRDLGLPNHAAIKQWHKQSINGADARQRMLDDGLPADAVDKALSDSEIVFQNSPQAKAFLRGDITKDGFIQSMQSIGVSAAGANKLAELLGYRIVNHPAVKDFAVGRKDKGDALSMMVTDGMNADVAERILDDADTALSQAFLVTCQRGIKRKYLLGELDKQQAVAELQSRGTVSGMANRMVDWWDCEKSSQGKHVAVNKLCQWLARGAITALDFRKRLTTLGYTEADAALVVEDCLISINAKRAADARKEAKERVAEETRAQRALEKQIQQGNRIAAQLAAAQKKALATRNARDKQFWSAVQKAAAKTEIELGAIVNFMKDEKSRVQRDYALDQDQALQALIQSSEAWEGGDLDSYSFVLTGIAEAISSGFPSEN